MVDFWVGRLLAKLEALNLADDTIVFFTSDHGFYFGEHGYFGKAEWVHAPEATVTRDSSLPDWLAESWLLTVGWSPLYKELTNVPLISRVPGLQPGRRRALTTAPDLAPTTLDLVGVEAPEAMRGDSFAAVLRGEEAEHREFVLSSWPLYFAQGALTTAVDSVPRRVASHMPITVTTPDRALVFGGPEDPPELYDLENDGDQQTNLWEHRSGEGAALMERAVSFLEQQHTPEHHLKLRREAAGTFAWRPPPRTGGEDHWGNDESKEAG